MYGKPANLYQRKYWDRLKLLHQVREWMADAPAEARSQAEFVLSTRQAPDPEDTEYAYQTTAPGESEWLSDENYSRALDQRYDTAWWRTRPTAGYVWVRVQVPADNRDAELG